MASIRFPQRHPRFWLGVMSTHSEASAPAAHAAAQLMQLRQAESFGVLDQHDGRIRDIDADLDDRCRHQNVNLPRGKGTHYSFFLFALQAAVKKRYLADPRKLSRSFSKPSVADFRSIFSDSSISG